MVTHNSKSDLPLALIIEEYLTKSYGQYIANPSTFIKEVFNKKKHITQQFNVAHDMSKKWIFLILTNIIAGQNIRFAFFIVSRTQIYFGKFHLEIDVDEIMVGKCFFAYHWTS